MGPDGQLREITLSAPLRSDEVLVPEPDVEEIKSWPRARRRAWYREQKRKGK